MSEKPVEDPEKDEDVGFRLSIPGLGWLHGDGNHLSQLMPTIRWILVLLFVLYISERLIREWKS